MLKTHKPSLDELWFRESLLADAKTMSYNAAWGGTIPFPEETRKKWYDTWLRGSEYQHYYRYLYDTDSRSFVGEIAYHYDAPRGIHICDVIVLAERRKNGFGTIGLRLLCQAAKENGIKTLYDEIAADNPSHALFLKNGFVTVYQDDEVIVVKKEL